MSKAKKTGQRLNSKKMHLELVYLLVYLESNNLFFWLWIMLYETKADQRLNGKKKHLELVYLLACSESNYVFTFYELWIKQQSQNKD